MSDTRAKHAFWLDSRVDKFFKITERGSTVGREVRGGVVTFFTMAYIIVLNPLILGFAQDADGKFLGDASPPGNLAMIAAGTALVAGVMTILMGVVANFPLALATGLGLNAFVAFSIASQMTWADAMGLIVLEGLVILILVLTGFREAVFHAVPGQLKIAISVGIGLFIALIGFVDAGFVRRIPDAANTTVPVQLGPSGSLQGWPVLVFVLGLGLLITLWVKKVKGAILISIVATTIIAIIVEAIGNFGAGRCQEPDRLGPHGAQAARLDLRQAELRHPRRVQPVRLVLLDRLRGRDPADLHPDAGRLLRHDGHDDRDRRRGRPARRRGHPAEHPPHPGRRLRRRRRGWRRRRLVEHLLHRVGLGRGGGRAHRPGVGRHRRAVPVLDLPVAAGQGDPERGGRARPSCWSGS